MHTSFKKLARDANNIVPSLIEWWFGVTEDFPLNTCYPLFRTHALKSRLSGQAVRVAWYKWKCHNTFTRWEKEFLLKIHQKGLVAWNKYFSRIRGLEFFFVFTALHAMQTLSSHENSVCLSVRPCVRPSFCQTRDLWQNWRMICADFCTIRKIIKPSFRRRVVGGGEPFHVKFLVNRLPLEQNRRFSPDIRP